MASSGVNS
jgi:hypothetical protein